MDILIQANEIRYICDSIRKSAMLSDDPEWSTNCDRATQIEEYAKNLEDEILKLRRLTNAS